MKHIGVPSGGGIKEAGESGVFGAIGGALFGLAKQFLGAGWLGGIAGILVAGSVLKGDEGQDIATTLGVLVGADLTGGLSTGSINTSASTGTVGTVL